MFQILSVWILGIDFSSVDELESFVVFFENFL